MGIIVKVFRDLFNNKFLTDRQEISAAPVQKTCKRFQDTSWDLCQSLMLSKHRPKIITNVEILQSFIDYPPYLYSKSHPST